MRASTVLATIALLAPQVQHALSRPTSKNTVRPGMFANDPISVSSGSRHQSAGDTTGVDQPIHVRPVHTLPSLMQIDQRGRANLENHQRVAASRVPIGIQHTPSSSNDVHASNANEIASYWQSLSPEVQTRLINLNSDPTNPQAMNPQTTKALYELRHQFNLHRAALAQKQKKKKKKQVVPSGATRYEGKLKSLIDRVQNDVSGPSNLRAIHPETAKTLESLKNQLQSYRILKGQIPIVPSSVVIKKPIVGRSGKSVEVVHGKGKAVKAPIVAPYRFPHSLHPATSPYLYKKVIEPPVLNSIDHEISPINLEQSTFKGTDKEMTRTGHARFRKAPAGMNEELEEGSGETVSNQSQEKSHAIEQQGNYRSPSQPSSSTDTDTPRTLNLFS